MKERLRPFVLAGRRVRRGEVRLADIAYGRGTTFSQFGEDAVLGALLADVATGFYVDVGAYDPYDASNTYNLYRRGWRGINLEPDPLAFARVSRGRPRDINLCLAVSGSEGAAPFASAGSFSGIADSSHLWPGLGQSIVVQTAPLRQILDQHLPAGRRIDLLDVDCEGHDLVVLRSNDWDRYRPELILAEWHENEGVRLYLEDVGYELIVRMRLTGIFRKR